MKTEPIVELGWLDRHMKEALLDAAMWYHSLSEREVLSKKWRSAFEQVMWMRLFEWAMHG